MQQRSVIWHGRAMPRTLSQADFQQAAERLGCDGAAIRAVWEVEAGGRHFLDDGSVIRRFEPHQFPREHWGRIGYGAQFLTARQRASAARRGWVGTLRPWQLSVLQSSEPMFERAVSVDQRAAISASSWGAPQIMAGMNHRAAGFSSPEDMVRHMADGAPQQLGAFVQLLEGWGLAPALRGHDWRAFAARYNGSGQVDHYARLIEAAYRRHSGGAASAVVLRVGARGASVAKLQRALGIDDDGAFGPQTLAAVRQVQKDAGLPVDGVVGHRTWAAIRDLAESAPEPEAQDTVADARIDLSAQITGATGAVMAVAAAAGELRKALPDDLYVLMMWGAAGAVALHVAAIALRRMKRG